MSAEEKDYIKAELLKTIDACADKIIIHKICNLIIEIAGTMYE